MTPVYEFKPGPTPLLISIPHSGTTLPVDISNKFTSEAKLLLDTDWHVDRLYQFASSMGANILSANYSRYVIDLNRSPDDNTLYQNNTTTSLCPLYTFSGKSIYLEHNEPDKNEIKKRLHAYWTPYHNQLKEKLSLLIKKYGVAVLFEAHSIQSVVPLLFDGVLPNLNLGTNKGLSLSTELEKLLQTLCANEENYSSCINGRFIGGYITRHYGKPKNNIHALQLEITQNCYLNECTTNTYDEFKAKSLQQFLTKMINQILLWCENY